MFSCSLDWISFISGARQEVVFPDRKSLSTGLAFEKGRKRRRRGTLYYYVLTTLSGRESPWDTSQRKRELGIERDKGGSKMVLPKFFCSMMVGQQLVALERGNLPEDQQYQCSPDLGSTAEGRGKITPLYSIERESNSGAKKCDFSSECL